MMPAYLQRIRDTDPEAYVRDPEQGTVDIAALLGYIHWQDGAMGALQEGLQEAETEAARLRSDVRGTLMTVRHGDMDPDDALARLWRNIDEPRPSAGRRDRQRP